MKKKTTPSFFAWSFWNILDITIILNLSGKSLYLDLVNKQYIINMRTCWITNMYNDVIGVDRTLIDSTKFVNHLSISNLFLFHWKKMCKQKGRLMAAQMPFFFFMWFNIKKYHAPLVLLKQVKVLKKYLYFELNWNIKRNTFEV